MTSGANCQSQQLRWGRGLSPWHDVGNHQWVSRCGRQWEERQKRLEHVETDGRTVVNVIWATLCAIECRRALLLVHTVQHTLTQQKQCELLLTDWIFIYPAVKSSFLNIEIQFERIKCDVTLHFDILSSYLEFGGRLLIKKNRDNKKYLTLFPTRKFLGWWYLSLSESFLRSGCRQKL